MNNKSLQDLVKGRYGRKIAYADVETITPENVLEVVSENIGIFNSIVIPNSIKLISINI